MHEKEMKHHTKSVLLAISTYDMTNIFLPHCFVGLFSEKVNRIYIFKFPLLELKLKLTLTHDDTGLQTSVFR